MKKIAMLFIGMGLVSLGGFNDQVQKVPHDAV